MRLAATGVATALSCLALLASPMQMRPAMAQLSSREAISLQDQILELRHQMQQRGIDTTAPAAPPLASPVPADAAPAPNGDVAGGSLTPQLLDRVSTLEEEVRSLRGQVDQLSNQVQQQNAALAKQVGDLSFAQQQARPGAAPAPATQETPTPQADARRTPERALQNGQAALTRRDYATAGADAREALAGGKAAHQIEARYLLAQSLAGQRQFQQAATAYYDAYSHAPHSGRAPDALLGVSASLLALHDRSDACQALQKLAAEFPHPAARVRAAASQQRARAGCR